MADLALALADAAVLALRPEAVSWWSGSAPRGDREGLRLHRTVARSGGDLEDLRLGSGPPARLLGLAIEMLVVLADGPVAVFVDHLDEFVLHQPRGPEVLGALRSAAQEHSDLHLVLIGRGEGPVESALQDEGHPLFHSAEVHRIHRLDPLRTEGDIALITKSEAANRVSIRVAVDLAAGVPAYVWSIVDLAPHADSASGADRALRGWQDLRAAAAIGTAGEFSVLRAVHPLAQTVVAATAAGIGPYTAPFNDGRIRAALNSLESVGILWRPRPRDWAVAEPNTRRVVSRQRDAMGQASRARASTTI